MTTATQAPDAPYLDRSKDVAFDPVFIIGPHRSGTTILYKVLMESGCFNVTTAYHVLRHDRLLDAHFNDREPQARAELQGLFDSKGLKDRDFDSMKISPDIPEEYCFALPHQGRRPMVRENNRAAFFEFCRKVQLIQDPKRPLLLKNPFDTVNFAYLSEICPNAKFILNYRNPVDVINSQMRALRGVIGEKNEYVALVMQRYRKTYESPMKLALARFLYGEKSPVLYEQVERFIKKNYDYVVQHVDALGDRVCGVRYTDLCSDPNGTIRRVLDFLGLREDAPLDYKQWIEPRKSKLVPEVEKNRQRIEERNREYCRKFGV